MQRYVQQPFKKWDILKGDQVVINAGKDAGKQGKVLKVYRKQNKILVQDINIKLKRMKRTQEQDGQIKQMILPIHVSNANLQDPETGKGTKVKYGFLEDGLKVRISKKSGSLIPKPEHLTYQERKKDLVDGVKDTDTKSVLEITYKGEDFGKIEREFRQFIQEKERRESLLVFDV